VITTEIDAYVVEFRWLQWITSMRNDTFLPELELDALPDWDQIRLSNTQTLCEVLLAEGGFWSS